VLFVSHDTGTVGQLCRRAVWLDGGRVKQDGAAHAVLGAYLKDVVGGASTVDVPTTGDGPVEDLSVAVLDAEGLEQSTLRRDEPLTLRVRFRLARRLPSLDLALYVVNEAGVRVLNENASTAGLELGGSPREREVRLSVPPVLPAGDHVLGLWLGNDEETFAHREILRLSVLPLPTDRLDTVHGVARPAVRWSEETAVSDGA
jgi:hypothetical protein